MLRAPCLHIPTRVPDRSYVWFLARSTGSLSRNPARLRSGSRFLNVVFIPALHPSAPLAAGKTLGLILPAMRQLFAYQGIRSCAKTLRHCSRGQRRSLPATSADSEMVWKREGLCRGLA